MENLNFHKQKLYSLIAAGIALVSIILPWMSLKGGFGGSLNGFHSWGLLSVIGVIGVVVACFLEDKTKPFEGKFKQIALGSFGAIALGAVIFLIRILTFGGGTYGSGEYRVKISNPYTPGFGLFICLLVGAAGVLYILGIIKIPDTKKPPTA